MNNVLAIGRESFGLWLLTKKTLSFLARGIKYLKFFSWFVIFQIGSLTILESFPKAISMLIFAVATVISAIILFMPICLSKRDEPDFTILFRIFFSIFCIDLYWNYL